MIPKCTMRKIRRQTCRTMKGMGGSSSSRKRSSSRALSRGKSKRTRSQNRKRLVLLRKHNFARLRQTAWSLSSDYKNKGESTTYNPTLQVGNGKLEEVAFLIPDDTPVKSLDAHMKDTNETLSKYWKTLDNASHCCPTSVRGSSVTLVNRTFYLDLDRKKQESIQSAWFPPSDENQSLRPGDSHSIVDPLQMGAYLEPVKDHWKLMSTAVRNLVLGKKHSKLSGKKFTCEAMDRFYVDFNEEGTDLTPRLWLSIERPPRIDPSCKLEYTDCKKAYHEIQPTDSEGWANVLNNSVLGRYCQLLETRSTYMKDHSTSDTRLELCCVELPFNVIFHPINAWKPLANRNTWRRGKTQLFWTTFDIEIPKPPNVADIEQKIKVLFSATYGDVSHVQVRENHIRAKADGELIDIINPRTQKPFTDELSQLDPNLDPIRLQKFFVYYRSKNDLQPLAPGLPKSLKTITDKIRTFFFL